MDNTSAPPDVVTDVVDVYKDRSYSRRRAIYVYVITLFILVTTAILVFRGYTGPLVELFVRESLALLGTVVLLYLGAGVIDRSRVLDKLGDGFQRTPAPGIRREETTVTRTVAENPRVPATAAAPVPVIVTNSPTAPVPTTDNPQSVPVPDENAPIADPVPNPVASGTISRNRRRVG